VSETDFQALAATVLEAHPAEAARALEEADADSAAALLAGVDADIAASVLTSMDPAPAIRCLGRAEAAWAGPVLGRLPTTEAAALLRGLSPAARRRLLDRLPRRRAWAVQLALHYPPQTVGAWMEPDVATLHPDATLAAARALAGESLGCELFVVSGGRHLEGVVRVPALMRVPAEGPLAPLVEKEVPTLGARTPLDQAAAVPGWQAFNSLPVVDRQGALIGLLPARALARERADSVVDAEESEGLGWALLRGYGGALAALGRAWVGRARYDR
jgi:magnesium transporter